MRVWHIFAAAAALGLLSLMLVPIETIAPLPYPPLTIRALAIVQPALLTIVAVATGLALAPKVGLHAPLIEAAASGGPVSAILKRQLPAALVAGGFVALILIGYDIWSAPQFAAASGLGAKLAAFRVPVVTRLLYGGIVEELLTRWGLVSLFAWTLWRLSGRPEPVPPRIYVAAIALAAILFAAGHLPLLFLVNARPGALLVAAVILGNMIPGVAFGWLFWKRGLEAAIMAHAFAHALWALVR